MPLLPWQPRLYPNPAGRSLSGKTAVVTGATTGMGLETCRQLLALDISILVLAVRNTSKGEAVKETLLAERPESSAKQDIRVVRFDAEDVQCVVECATRLKTDLTSLDFLVLNAGNMHEHYFEAGPSGYERLFMVNYFSSALFLLDLLPLLEAGQEPARVTWMGSRAHYTASSLFHGGLPLAPSIFGWFQMPEHYGPWTRYPQTKLLAVLFVYEFARRVDPTKVIINMLCPGMVNTGMVTDTPLPFGPVLRFMNMLGGRPVEEGGWLVLHALVYAGPETHGRFHIDSTVQSVGRFVESERGQQMQRDLWRETLSEAVKHVGAANVVEQLL